MNKLLDILLPRFITEDVALRDTGDHFEIACSMHDVKPGETFAAVGTIRSLNLFGQALFPQMLGEPRPWSSTSDEALDVQRIIAGLEQEDASQSYSEVEHFVAEHMLQRGFQMINAEGSVYACNLNQMLALLGDRGGDNGRKSGFDRQPLPDNLLHRINEHMNGDQCPTSESLGECAYIGSTPHGSFEAALYLWDDSFDDSTAVASWFRQEGCTDITISLTHYSDWNDDRNGRAPDGARQWIVDFAMAKLTPVQSGSPAGQNLPQQEGDQ